MATKLLKWRVNPSASQTEGTTIKYVDSRVGNDATGDGTRQKPYRTISKANNTISGSTGVTIVCRGIFNEHVVGKVSGSTYLANLRADYYGAAIHDGLGENELIWFGSYTNMIMINQGNSLEAETIDVGQSGAYNYGNKRAPLVGVGRAYNVPSAGHASNVSGFASSPVLFHNGKLWRGGAGTTSGSQIIWSHPVRNANNCGVKIFGTNVQSTFRDCKAFVDGWQAGARERRSLYNTLTTTGTFTKCLFSNFDIFVDEGSKDTFTNCFFDKDCKFYYRDQTTTNKTEMWIDLADPTAESVSITLDETNHVCHIEGVASIPAAITALRNAGNITQQSSVAPAFSGCKWSKTEGENEIFNNPAGLDFSLIDGCGATTATHDYYGALPPCKSIKVYYDANNQYASDGHVDCWDNRTKNGCVTVADGAICVEDSSPASSGSIFSKIVKTNQLFTQFAAIYSLFADQAIAKKFILSKIPYFGARYGVNDTLVAGTYIVRGSNVTYNSTSYADGDIIVVGDSDPTSFTGASGDELQYVADPNIMNCVYCRCRSHVYATITKAQTAAGHANWATGIVYMNIGNSTISYNGRSIVAGESFVIDDASVGITGVSDDYEIAIMFDDRNVNESSRIVPTTEWIPAQLWGKYFVGKNNGAITHDSDGVPISSGNYNAWNESGQPTCGGYYSIMNQPYTQFAIFVNKE